MTLPAIDLQYLGERIIEHRVAIEANMTCVVLAGFQVPLGYDRERADLLLRLNPGYPDVPPDMWWFDPPLRRADGRPIQAADTFENHLGRTWQRWSRHFSTGQWRSGIDTLESFVALIRRELVRCVQ
ncbi:MAG TPA: E2/UBC family protein [Gemmatimonadaceae bacterium]|nr:E2/UBC family protein [Gemmatimonadaceae bacterium]